ncbi:uncharacterized protein [Nerophis lumbriciformis]|uniref:uncharacterized protein isoform X3 n=1 Tax=Nerophis lumbriciformis TaxID=546530 RepID=UPI003BAA72AC
MVYRLTLTIVLQTLALLFIVPACEASSLGLTVHVEPMQSDGGQSVRAYFTAIASNPCPPLTGVCTEGVNCTLYKAYEPFSGSKPGSGWCVRQWQQVVPSKYNGTLTLNSTTSFYVSMDAGPHVRANSGKLNYPPYVALPPPLRAHANCPHHIPLSVRDLDGDKVRCRFAMEEQGECVNCSWHSFIELQQDACTLTFTGNAPAGHYSIYLMAEDHIPTPKICQTGTSQPLSSVPVHLSLTVEAASSSCTDEAVATGKTPKEHYTFPVLPFEEVKFGADFMSKKESVSEIAVVGQPGLFKYDFASAGAESHVSMSWVRSENELTHVLPVCFVANTMSLQSEPRCVWLYQRETKTLPTGTELRCNKTEMTLVLPLASLSNINLAELQLNSASCPVSYNDTHLTARISLNGCGTKTVQAGTELVYTNTLKSVRSFTMISRHPSLILPLACRIPSVKASGPVFNVTVPVESFDDVDIRLEFHFPGEGPLSRFTGTAQIQSVPLLRSKSALRYQGGSGNGEVRGSGNGEVRGSGNDEVRGSGNGEVRGSGNAEVRGSGVGEVRGSGDSEVRGSGDSEVIGSGDSEEGSTIDKLDLHLFANTTVDRVQMIIKSCLTSETADFAASSVILQEGCAASNTTVEIITDLSNVTIYRIDLPTLNTQGSTMYVRCVVQLCVTFLPSQKCPAGCGESQVEREVPNAITRTVTVNSGPQLQSRPLPWRWR